LAVAFLMNGCGTISRTTDNVEQTTAEIKRTVAVVAKKVNDVDQAVKRTTDKVEEVRDNVADTVANVKEKVDSTVDKVSGIVDGKINAIKEGIDEKIETLRDSLSKEVDEAVADLDVNGDGRASLKEAVAFMKQDGGRWSDPEAWLQIVLAVVGSWLGLTGIKKGGKPIVAALHRTGREELAKKDEHSSSNTS